MKNQMGHSVFDFKSSPKYNIKILQKGYSYHYNFSTEIRYSGEGTCRLVCGSRLLGGYKVLDLPNRITQLKLDEGYVWDVSNIQ